MHILSHPTIAAALMDQVDAQAIAQQHIPILDHLAVSWAIKWARAEMADGSAGATNSLEAEVADYETLLVAGGLSKADAAIVADTAMNKALWLLRLDVDATAPAGVLQAQKDTISRYALLHRLTRSVALASVAVDVLAYSLKREGLDSEAVARVVGPVRQAVAVVHAEGHC